MLAEGYVHFGTVSSALISPNGNSIMSIGEGDGIIAESTSKFINSPKSAKDKLDQLDTVSDHNLADVHDKSITAITNGFSNDLLIFSAEDGIFELNWSTMTSSNLFNTTENYKSVFSSKEGIVAALKSEESVIDLFHKERGLIGSIICDNEVEGCKLSYSGKFIAIYDEQNGIRIYETETQKNIQSIEMRSCQTGFEWSERDELFVCDSNNEKTIVIMLPESQTETKMNISSHDDCISSIALFGQNTIVTLSAKDNKICTSLYDESYTASVISSCKFHETDGESETQEDISPPSLFKFLTENLFCIGEEYGKVSIWRFSTKPSEPAAEKPKEESVKPKQSKQKKTKNVLDASGNIVDTIKVDESDLSSESDSEEGIPLSKLGEGVIETDSEEEDTDPMLDKSVTEETVPKLAITSSSDYSDEYDREMKREERANQKRREREERFNKAFGDSIVDQYSSYSYSSSDDEFVTTDKKLTTKQKEEELRQFTAKQIAKQKYAQEEEDEIEKMINDGDDLNKIVSSESESSSSSDYTEEDEEFPKTFMPGSSYDYDGNRKFLCWNDTAAIFLRLVDEEESKTAIDVEFHDKYANSDMHSDNTRSFVLATVNGNGFVGASRTSFVYKFNREDGTDCEFKYSFKNETIDLIALGSKWVAVYTSRLILRVFSTSGLEIATLSMPAAPVTMIGSNDLLFVVYGDKLQFTMYNIYNRTIVANGTIPVKYPLRWVGFDEDDNIYAFGSDLMLQELVHRFGYHWTPVCNVRYLLTNGMNYEDDEVKDDSESDEFGLGDNTNEDEYGIEKQDKIEYTSFWCVYVSQGKLFGVPLKDENMPRAAPLPSLVEIPVAPLTLEKGAQSFIEASYRIDNAPTKYKKDLLRAKRDTITLKHFSSLLRENDEIHAYEYAKTLFDESARQVALMYTKNYCEENGGDTDLYDRIKQIFDADEEEDESEEDNENFLFANQVAASAASSTSSETSDNESDDMPPPAPAAASESEEVIGGSDNDDEGEDIQNREEEEEHPEEEEEAKKEEEEEAIEEEEEEEYEDSIVEDEDSIVEE